MALSFINLSSDVYFVCVNHALSTEREEIVGLLVGEVDEKSVAHVLAVVILRRSDKRKDRVEISPEQLSNASTEADRLSCILKRPIRIIGWYHSHPKLTVWPSPIDVNTQDSYQLMDAGFIGMIFSVFNEDPSKKGGRVQMTCFQSQTVIEDGNVEKKRLDVPVHLTPSTHVSNVCMKALIQLPRFLCQEEQLAYQITNQMDLDYLTRLHNSSVYLRSMGQIAEVICGPLIKMLEERIISNELKRKKLQNKKKEISIIFEQIERENARSSAIENISSADEEQIECSLSSDTETNADTVIDQESMMESFAFDDVLLEDISSQSVNNSLEPTEFVMSDQPICFSGDELCISSSVETYGDGCSEAVVGNGDILSPDQEMHIEASSSPQKDDLSMVSPPVSPKDGIQ